MNEQMKSVVARSLQARITQCTCELEVLRNGSHAAGLVKNGALVGLLHEHQSYWQGEREAAMAALHTLCMPGVQA